MQEDEEKLSDDPEEHMKIENELMRIKLAAQYGDAFHMEGTGEMTVEMENQFLKSIMAFEESIAAGDHITLYERIGKPPYQPVELLQAATLEIALSNLMDLLQQHQVHVDFVDGPYDDATIYRFITEELFNELVDKSPVEGMIHGFIYEEFHPNHKKEIEKIAHRFLYEWFTRGFIENESLLSDMAITAEGVQLPREKLIEKLRLFFDAFHYFADDKYNIMETSVDIEAGEDNGFGFVEGMLKYDAGIDNDELIHFEGPYKIYFQLLQEEWSVFYFVLPGFKW